MVVEARVLVLRRNWMPVAVCVVLVVLGLLVTRALSPLALFGYLAAWFGVVFGPILFFRNASPRAKVSALCARVTGVTIEGHGEIRSEDILEAKVIPGRGSVVVALALRHGRALSLRMDAHDARALVDMLGARRTRFRLVLPFGRRFLAAFVLLESLAVLVARGDMQAWLFTLPGGLLYALLVGWLVGFVRGRLVVGADGFTTRWLFWERFVAFRDVAAVRGSSKLGEKLGDQGTQDTLVTLSSGRNVRFRTVEAPNTEEERGAESRAMLAHMNEAFECSRRLQAGSLDIPSLVERGPRSAREWLSGLDALVRGGGARYRVAAVSPDMLVDLANDPSATIESRVGAAAALVRMGDDELRRRVRVAAEGCAAPELRDTLLALSDARDDAAAEMALGSLRR